MVLLFINRPIIARCSIIAHCSMSSFFEKYGSPANKLGGGTYSLVFRTKKNYALKRSPIESDQGVIANHVIEVAILKSLSHPNVIKFIDIDLKDTRLYMITELFDGHLRNYPKPSPDEFKLIAWQLVNGLNYIHSKDIVHGDIKPDNILFKKVPDHNGTKGNRVTRVIYSDFNNSEIGGSIYTLNNTCIYTLPYRPPEIILGGSHTQKADIWALGVTLFEIFTKKVLFPQYTETDMLTAIFFTVGPLNLQEWPDVQQYPKYSEKYDLIGNFSLKLSMFNNDYSLYELIKGCLTVYPKKRLDAYELCMHPYFDDIRGKFSSITNSDSEDDFYYLPKVSVLSPLDFYTQQQSYPDVRSFGFDFLIGRREKVIYWILKVCQVFELSIIPLGKIIYIFDTYISKQGSMIDVYSLPEVALASVSLGSFYVGITLPMVDIQAIYPKVTAEDVITMMNNIIKRLDFDLYPATVADFISIFASSYSPDIFTLTVRLYKFSLITKLCFRFAPKEIAIGLIMISCQINKEPFQHKALLNEMILQVPLEFFKELRKNSEVKHSVIKREQLETIEWSYDQSELITT